MISSGLGHATSFLGSDTLSVIPAVRYFYNEQKDFVAIASVNASEHSVSTTKIFTVGEKQMIIDWLKEFPTGILSIVADTFDLWKLLLEYITDPEVKALIIARDGKLVIRPDSGDPVDITCGLNTNMKHVGTIGFTYANCSDDYKKEYSEAEYLGVVEILWDIFGGTINAQGYKVLDSHIGAIYGDSINLERQISIYIRLASKGFASTNIVLGVGSFTYQYNTRDTFGFAAKGAWFEVEEERIDIDPKNDLQFEGFHNPTHKVGHDIYKDPVTDDGTKKSLKGFQFVNGAQNGDIVVLSEVTEEVHSSDGNLLEIIYLNGTFPRQTKYTEIRNRLNN
jgi:nicotinamide phosphoribosyltransferase